MAHTTTPIKLEINTSVISSLEEVLEIVENVQKNHPGIIVTIRVQ